MEPPNRKSKKTRWSQSVEAQVLQIDKSTIEILPNEMILKVLKHMNASDALAFSQTCKRFFSLYQSESDLNLSISNGLLLGTPLKSFLINHSNLANLTSCNFNGVYWIPKDIVISFLSRCVQLEKCFVAETNLALEDIIWILLICPNITALSLTLRKSDQGTTSHLESLRKIQEDPKKKEPSSPPQLASLQKLKRIEVIVADGCSLSDLMNLLRNCVNLEEFVVLRAPSSGFQQINTIVPLLHLKSFIFVTSPWNAHAVDPFFDVKEHPDFVTYWSNILTINRLKATDRGIVSLCWNANGLQAPHDAVHFTDGDAPARFSTLQSLYEREPIFMQNPTWSEHLKLASCFYDGRTFHSFCVNHQQIEVLKLMYREKPRLEDGSKDPTDRASPQWNKESWKELPKLKILSIDARLFPVSEKPGSFSFMGAVMQSCLIQELELFGTPTRIFETLETINEMELSSIAQCTTLKRLTMSNFMVSKGQFLEEILKNCVKLESLRILNIGGRVCCYSKNLIEGLKFSKNLKTFCMTAGKFDLPIMEKLLKSLHQCTSLSRVGLIWPVCSWEKSGKDTLTEFSTLFFKLCCALPQLVALFGLFNVSADICNATNRRLKDGFIKQRQAFRCDLQSKIGENQSHNFETGYQSDILPILHSDTLTRFQSQVATFPFDYKSVLNLP